MRGIELVSCTVLLNRPVNACSFVVFVPNDHRDEPHLEPVNMDKDIGMAVTKNSIIIRKSKKEIYIDTNTKAKTKIDLKRRETNTEGEVKYLHHDNTQVHITMRHLNKQLLFSFYFM